MVMSADKERKIAPGMESPYEEQEVMQSDAVMDMLSKLSPEQVEEILETWTSSDIAGALDTLTATGMKGGEGITTPGKYGVYVGNPMGALGAGIQRGYGSTSKLLEALRDREKIKGLSSAFGKQQGSSNAVNPLEYMP